MWKNLLQISEYFMREKEEDFINYLIEIFKSIYWLFDE